MKCKKCKMDIPKGAKICPYCKTKQGTSVGCAFLVVIMIIVGVVGFSNAGKKSDTNSTSSSTVADFVDDIKAVTGFEQETANAIKSRLDSAGLRGYKSITLNSSDDEYSYYEIVTAQKSFIMTLTKQGEIDELNIKFAISSPPLIVDNVVEHCYSEYTITDSLKNTLRLECQLQLEKILVAPSTADYPAISKWTYGKDWETGYIYVSSYVDSENAFGAKLREDFKFGFKILDYNAETYSIVFCKFGDSIIMDNR